MRGDLFEEGEIDAVAINQFDAAEPDAVAVAQFVDLAWLGAEDAAQMVRGVAFDDGGRAGEFFYKESSAHGGILSYARQISCGGQ
jgi:hypothetical protein